MTPSSPTRSKPSTAASKRSNAKASPEILKRLVLADVAAPMCDAFERFCGELDFVSVHRGSILEVETDAVVSPANSFGFMDGGIDALYMDYFGAAIQMQVRRMIYERHGGELVVGTADLVDTGNAKIPFLIVAPTMRVPMVLRDSVNAYLAARAAFILARDHPKIETVAVPGLGTGVGRIGFNTCAHQVRAAIDDVLLGKYEMPHSWAEASERHQLLYTDRPTRLQY